MKIFIFTYDNYYTGKRTYKVLAHNVEEATKLLNNNPGINHYIMDDETYQVGDPKICEIDKPKIL